MCVTIPVRCTMFIYIAYLTGSCWCVCAVRCGGWAQQGATRAAARGEPIGVTYMHTHLPPCAILICTHLSVHTLRLCGYVYLYVYTPPSLQATPPIHTAYRYRRACGCMQVRESGDGGHYGVGPRQYAR